MDRPAHPHAMYPINQKFLFAKILFFVLFVYTLTGASPIFAQDDWKDAPSAPAYDAADQGEVNKEAYDYRSTINNFNAITCQIIPGGPTSDGSGDGVCTNDTQTALRRYDKTALGVFNKTIASIYGNPPANFAFWLNDTSVALGFRPKPAYAQGVGFSSLTALLPIWKAFRNIAYLLMSIVLVVIGFMVMFRRKIDPKTVVTVQNSIPRIIVTMLLVTFSYAIAGVLIDLMYLVMLLAITIIVNASNGVLGQNTAAAYLGGGFGTIIAALFGGGWRSYDDLLKLLYFPTPLVGAGVGIVTAISAVTALPLAIFIGALPLLIISIAVLIGIVRLFFTLLSAYIQVIIAVIIGPLQIMLDAIPGNNSFSSWIRNLIANLAVFPISAAMILIGTYLAGSSGFLGTPIWSPPLLSDGSGVNSLVGLIGLGVLLTTPNVANSIKEQLKAKPPVNAGLGAILGPIGAGAGQGMNLLYQGSTIGHYLRPAAPRGDAPNQFAGTLKAAQSGAQGNVVPGTGSGGGGH